MKRVITTSIRDVDYYGQSAARKYGEEILNALSGTKISFNPRDTKNSKGLKYEAHKLNIPYDKFKEAIIGLASEGQAIQLNSEEYKIL